MSHTEAPLALEARLSNAYRWRSRPRTATVHTGREQFAASGPAKIWQPCGHLKPRRRLGRDPRRRPNGDATGQPLIPRPHDLRPRDVTRCAGGATEFSRFFAGKPHGHRSCGCVEGRRNFSFSLSPFGTSEVVTPTSSRTNHQGNDHGKRHSQRSEADHQRAARC
jgi:hypothetical protein